MKRLSITLLVVAGLTSPVWGQDCREGQAVTVDTDGHCCWTGQAWHSEKKRCVGIPLVCPEGMTAEGQSCVEAACPEGQEKTADTDGHCCWPGQAWSALRETCLGIPTCPEGMDAVGEACVAPVMGTLMVASRPAATVYLDGKKMGVTPVKITQPPGTYELRLDAQQRSVKKTIVLRASEITKVVHRFD